MPSVVLNCACLCCCIACMFDFGDLVFVFVCIWWLELWLVCLGVGLFWLVWVVLFCLCLRLWFSLVFVGAYFILLFAFRVD